MFVEHFPRGVPNATPRAFPFPLDPLLGKLSPTDQAEYLRLVNIFAFAEDRNKRNLGMSTFVKHLSMIHAFVCRGDAFDALRGVLCGIEFGIGAFLVNTSRLKKLMFRSKSCMNGCFQKLGYSVCRPAHEISSIFSQIMPGYGLHVFTARQWCVRKANESSRLCFIPNIKVEIAASESTPTSPVVSAGEETANSETKVPFLYDIHSLLNREPPFAAIHRMTCEPFPPIRS